MIVPQKIKFDWKHIVNNVYMFSQIIPIATCCACYVGDGVASGKNHASAQKSRDENYTYQWNGWAGLGCTGQSHSTPVLAIRPYFKQLSPVHSLSKVLLQLRTSFPYI